ncbi:hypothetical protein Salat_2541600 [Sesamum alatum]|uniref:CCHC-type domain-containing protein n=1 Tax=Sesamum alatum TaxID=300844 RepID=A0AAE1XSG9_9LAMI|nr:hypothetical protein Salat_2541600 [Sesamum alatum]
MVRIYVNITISLPLKWALQLWSEHSGVVVRFSYERFPNFCYLCGKVGHISMFCELHFHNFVNPGSDTSYSARLRAARPLRHLGAVMDDNRSTYVRRSPLVAEHFDTTF